MPSFNSKFSGGGGALVVTDLEVENTIDGGELACTNRTLRFVAHIHRDPIVSDVQDAALHDRAFLDGAFLEEAVEEVLECTAIEVDDGGV